MTMLPIQTQLEQLRVLLETSTKLEAQLLARIKEIEETYRA